MLLSTPMCRLMFVLQTPGYAAFTVMWSSFHSRDNCRTVNIFAMVKLICYSSKVAIFDKFPFYLIGSV
jgi:hypothetical protein